MIKCYFCKKIPSKGNPILRDSDNKEYQFLKNLTCKSCFYELKSNNKRKDSIKYKKYLDKTTDKVLKLFGYTKS